MVRKWLISIVLFAPARAGLIGEASSSNFRAIEWKNYPSVTLEHSFKNHVIWQIGSNNPNRFDIPIPQTGGALRVEIREGNPRSKLRISNASGASQHYSYMDNDSNGWAIYEQQINTHHIHETDTSGTGWLILSSNFRPVDPAPRAVVPDPPVDTTLRLGLVGRRP